MSSEWFYTTNKQQMGPVTWNELRELAEGGILKPQDLVWSEGMEEWIKAINQQGLFADDEPAVTKPKKSAYTEAKPPPGRRSKRTEEIDDEVEEDEREEKRKARKRDQDRSKMAVGLKIGLILAAIVFVLIMLVACGGLLIYLGIGGGGGGGSKNFSVNGLRPNTRSQDHTFTFKQGQRVIITAPGNVTIRNTDVDLYVYRGNAPDNMPLVADVSIGSSSRVEFVAPATDTYRVRIVNLGPGTASTRVTIVER